MSNKKYGLGYERKRKKELIKEGHQAFRSRGSFTLFDIISCNKEHWILESVKSTKQKYHSLNKEIEEIKRFDNAPSGTIKRIVLYKKGKRSILYEGVV